MRVVELSELDHQIAQDSSAVAIEAAGQDLVVLSFGNKYVTLPDGVARDFLYDLTAFFARKDLEEYPAHDLAELEESRAVLQKLARGDHRGQ